MPLTTLQTLPPPLAATFSFPVGSPLPAGARLVGHAEVEVVDTFAHAPVPLIGSAESMESDVDAGLGLFGSLLSCNEILSNPNATGLVMQPPGLYSIGQQPNLGPGALPNVVSLLNTSDNPRGGAYFTRGGQQLQLTIVLTQSAPIPRIHFSTLTAGHLKVRQLYVIHP